MNSIDDGLEGNGSKANPIAGQIVLADQLIGVAAEGGLDSEVQVGPTAMSLGTPLVRWPVAGCHVLISAQEILRCTLKRPPK